MISARVNANLHNVSAIEAADRRQKRTAQVCSASRERHASKARVLLVALATLLILLFSSEIRAAQHGDGIINTAVFTTSSHESSISSVSVQYVLRTPSELDFFKYAPASSEASTMKVPSTAYLTGDASKDVFKDLSAPLQVRTAEPIDLTMEIPLAPAAIFHRGEPVFLRISDPDQNVDFENAETVLVTLTTSDTEDKEVLRLTETGPNTGIFVGYIQSTQTTGGAHDGTLEVGEAGTVEALYVDRFDGSDNSVEATLFDPFCIVFDSRTGLPVDGAMITLINADTGELAEVFGDDGVSPYPSEVVSGGSVTDDSGAVYDFDPGAFRFPFVAPGRYRLDVIPPEGYSVPSGVSNADLQDLPGGPYALEIGSRGEVFSLDPGPALRIDIPADPIPGAIWIRKSAGKSRAAIGDFVPYTVTLENPEDGPVSGVTLTDRLPPGFRYRKGSARLDGERLDDPAISEDGRTLRFELGDLPGQSSLSLRYVAEVTAGARPGEAVNTATATAASGVDSNSTEATVMVGEDFFRTSTFLMGRVFTGGCGAPGEKEPDGLSGARIYLEDGTYVVTDQNGMFHFEGVRPGAHVVQLDLDTLPEQYEVVPCEENSRFAGRAYSQFVDLQGGSMWRTDFHVALKPRARGEVGIELNGSLDGNMAEFRIPVEVGDVALRNLRLSVTLPDGTEYLPESARIDGERVSDPDSREGSLLFRLGPAEAGRRMDLVFRCRIAAGAPGELPARAILTFDSPVAKDLTTPAAENLLLREVSSTRVPMPEFTVRPQFPSFGAELSPADKAELDRLAEDLLELEILRLYAVGHTDNVPIAQRSRDRYADNFALSEDRAESVARYLGEILELPPSKIVLSGMGAAVPLTDNGTAEGRALNRRVEVRVQCEKISEETKHRLLKNHSGEQKMETVGLRPGETWAEEEQKSEKEAEKAKEPGILSPADGSVLANRIAAVRVRLDGRLKPRLTLDGTEIPADRIGFKMEDKDSGLNLYSYIGIDFGGPGEHVLKIEGIGPFGNARFEQSANVTRTGEIAVIKLLESDGNIADGLTPVTLRVALLDEAGKVIRAPTQLEIREGNLLPPEERKAVENQVDLKNPEVTPGTTVAVDADGTVRFAPVQTGGLYTALLGHGDATLEVETYIQPKMRDWILVGLAEGTVGYNELSGNMESLPAETEEDLYEEGRVSFFAKGRVLGKWLLTMAYDSDKPDKKDQELFSIIDPDTYYTLYGDASQQAYEAESAEKLYLKLERDQFYALFGDYATGLSKTELSRYSRSLTGVKSEYNGRYATFNLFASDTDQGFVKDEIRGDGTSGLYRLTRRDIVLNSEKVTIEVRDRFQSQEILSSRELTRHVDYDIDYEEGTLFFKEPIPSRDESFNPVYIMVDYETNGSGNTSLNYGGRAAVRLPETGIEVGATAVHEEQDNAEGDLYGVDATWEVTDRTRVKAEAASSDSTSPGLSRDGSAWLAEVEHRSAKLDGRAYVREMENGFGLGQQRGSEEGTRKYGAEGFYRLEDDLEIGTQLYRQKNLETDAVRDVAQADVTYDAERYSLTTGLRFAEDDFADGVTERSTQALVGGTWRATERLLLRASREQSIGGDNESGDFPTRTTLGADYRITEKTTFFAAQEFTNGDDVDTQNTRAGFKTTPWTGGSLSSTLEQQTGEYGPRMFALFGLGQTLQLTERWSIDASVDRSHTVREPGARDFDLDVPPASGGTEDFTAVSLGATYKLEKWSWANRLEYRDGDVTDKWGLFSAIVGEVNEGLGLSARAQIFTTESPSAESTDGEIRLGFAYRPLYSRWIVLNRLDLLFDKEATPSSGYNNWRVVNNLNANYRPNRRTQLSLQYGAKFVKENIDGASYDGFTDLVGLEGRYDLDERWDVGLRGSVLHSWEGGQLDYGAGASLGYNAFTNAWVSVGYNVLGFEDSDFSAAGFTAQGPFMRFRLKFDQNDAAQAVRYLQRL